MKKVVTFILFVIVTVLSLGFHLGWWWFLFPTLSKDQVDPVQGVWFGYLLFTILTIVMPFVFYGWFKTGRFKTP